ncbi:MAG: hypothetical protein PHT49_01050 [Desulfovibrionales bacterium]|nr:hypothetical protein [Desulfovibrionales bacterium]
METAERVLTIFGDKLYQRRGREALPLLVRQAETHTPIYYSDLAKELGMSNPKNLNYVLGSIGHTLLSLPKELGEIPPIQCLVVNKNTGLPGEGIGWFIAEKEDFRRLPLKQKRAIVDAQLQRIFAYPRWRDILAELELHPVSTDYSPTLAKARTGGGGGESEQHRRLKEFLAKNPRILKLPARTEEGKTEYPLPSGDSVDILFKVGIDWIAVEVKSSKSDWSDIVRGIFQCVKYKSVIEAYQAVTNQPQSVRTLLVLESALPQDLLPMKNALGIEVMAGITMEADS